MLQLNDPLEEVSLMITDPLENLNKVMDLRKKIMSINRIMKLFMGGYRHSSPKKPILEPY